MDEEFKLHTSIYCHDSLGHEIKRLYLRLRGVFEIYRDNGPIRLICLATEFTRGLAQIFWERRASARVALTLFLTQETIAETYVDQASWDTKAEMVIVEENWLGSIQLTWEVTADRSAAAIGDRILITKNGEEERTFIVRTIIRYTNAEGILTCALSWLDQPRPTSSLRVTNCH